MGVEVAGRPYSGYQEIFDIEYLKGSAACQLLKGLYIAVYAPALSVKQIIHIEIANPYGAPTLSISISYSYCDWNEGLNLNHFGAILAGRLLSHLPHCISATAKPQDVALDISAKLDIPKTADLYEFVRQADTSIAELIQQCSKSDHGIVTTISLKPDEHGYKWWLRYIIIPVLGSALIITVLKWIF